MELKTTCHIFSGEGEEDGSLGQGEAHGDIEPDEDEVCVCQCLGV